MYQMKERIKMKRVIIVLDIDFVDDIDVEDVYSIWNKIDVDDVLENEKKVGLYEYVVLIDVDDEREVFDEMKK